MNSEVEWPLPEPQTAGAKVGCHGRAWRRHARRSQSGGPYHGGRMAPAVTPACGADSSATFRYGGCPWLVPGKTYSTGVLGLHEEIEDFYQYMTPTATEHAMRFAVYRRVRDTIQQLWPTTDVYIFGSFETGLYLPTSDVDIVVMGKWSHSPLEDLRDALVQAGVCQLSSVKVLDKAAVPIVKLTDGATGVRVDVSFNVKNGLLSVNQIKRYQALYPHLPRLVLAVKQFLVQRELNEVFTGGVSSYSVILMAVSFLQTHERLTSVFPGCNLGVLLIEFFELYGVKFNYMNTCIRVKDGGYAPRHEVECQFASQFASHSSPLCIEDPLNPSNDVGRSSYNMMRVKEAFQHAYYRLSFAVVSEGDYSDPNINSILGRVLRIADSAVERRLLANSAPESAKYVTGASHRLFASVPKHPASVSRRRTLPPPSAAAAAAAARPPASLVRSQLSVSSPDLSDREDVTVVC